MRRRLAALLCLGGTAMAPLAHAEWVKLMETARGHALYLDPKSIERKGDLRHLVELWNYRTPDSFGDRSSRLEVEYDCAATKRRILSWQGYPVPMGEGAVSTPRNGADHDWHPVAERTVSAAALGAACLQ